MYSRSRRDVLLTTASACVVFSGCSSKLATSERSETTDSDAASPPLETVPTCENTDVDLLYSVIPRGSAVLLTGRDRAEEVRDTILETADVEDESRVRLRTVEVVFADASVRYAVELDPGIRSAGSLLDTFGDTEDVYEIRRGQSPAAVAGLVSELRSYLQDDEGIQPGQMEIRTVRPDPPKPIRATATLTGVDSTALFDGSEPFEIRVKTADGERDVVNASDVTGVETHANAVRPGVELTLSGESRSRLVRVLESSGALQDPPAHEKSIRVYARSERIFSVNVGPDLAETMKSGEWDGTVFLSSKDGEEVETVVDALGVVSFSVPSNVSIDTCS